MRRVTRWARLMLALLSVACTERETPDVVTSPTTSIAKSALSKAGFNPQAAFHAKNHVDWVGKEHNNALGDFFATLGGGDPRNLCAEIENFTASRIVSDHDIGTPGQRQAVAKQGAALGKLCAVASGRAVRPVIPDGGQPVSLASVRRGASLASMYDVSEAANNLLAQVTNAVYATATSSELAGRLYDILVQADQLPAQERDLVYAVASVAQSSYDFWHANFFPLTEQFYPVYGDCLRPYSDGSTAISYCIGGNTLGLTGERGGSAAPLIFFAATTVRLCPSPNLTEVVKLDVQGGIVGGIAGFFATPPAAVGGAFIGATTASAAEGIWQIGYALWCKSRGGTIPQG